jgi:hypothetical protein
MLGRPLSRQQQQRLPPAEVENTIDAYQYMIIGNALFKRSRDEHLQLARSFRPSISSSPDRKSDDKRISRRPLFQQPGLQASRLLSSRSCQVIFRGAISRWAKSTRLLGQPSKRAVANLKRHPAKVLVIFSNSLAVIRFKLCSSAKSIKPSFRKICRHRLLR